MMQIPHALGHVKAGDHVYIGRLHTSDLERVAVTKAGKRHLTLANGRKYAVSDGYPAGWKSSRHASPPARAQAETPALMAAWHSGRLRRSFENELSAFRADPLKMTDDAILRVLRALNPEAWA
jgi:hypothetical protein